MPTKVQKELMARERRRMDAAGLFAQGFSRAEVGRRLGVSRVTAARWYKLWEASGTEALKTPGRMGVRSKLSEEQKQQLEQELLKGPAAHGYSTELWTLARIAALIEEITGIHYHPRSTLYLMRQLGWSCQKPAKRAKERHEDKIAGWIKVDWPEIKKKPVG